MESVKDILIPFEFTSADKQYAKEFGIEPRNFYKQPEKEIIDEIKKFLNVDIPDDMFYKNKLTDTIYGPKFINNYIPGKGYIDVNVETAYEKYYNVNPLGVIYAMELYKDSIYSTPMNKFVFKNLKFIEKKI